MFIPIAVFENIPIGTYTITEVGETVPYGYLVAEPQEVSVMYAETTTKEIKNDTTKVKISKQDITTGNELPGATLQILDKDGNVIAEWVSTNEPHYIEGILTAGETYTLHEVIAPNGYKLANDVTFTVSEDGSVDEVVMKDESIPDSSTPDTPSSSTPETPQTSNPKTGTNAGLAGIVAILGIAMVAVRKKRE